MMVATADDVIFLHPGDVASGTRGEQFQTLLGSCVAVVLTDPRRTLGVMCHIVHASPALKTPHKPTAHADVAMQTMVDLLAAKGIVASMCEAYVYGGGNMFPKIVPGPGVGDKNVRRVLDALTSRGIRVLSVDTGGAIYRQLRWTVGPDAPQTVAVPL
jgi:chemotaxis protein CheD